MPLGVYDHPPPPGVGESVKAIKIRSAGDLNDTTLAAGLDALHKLTQASDWMRGHLTDLLP